MFLWEKNTDKRRKYEIFVINFLGNINKCFSDSGVIVKVKFCFS
jgi:hypothetical protein